MNSNDLESVDKIKDEIHDLFNLYEKMVFKPLLFLNDFFYELRNQVDADFEALLLKSFSDKYTSSSLSLYLNNARQLIINELKVNETNCAKRFSVKENESEQVIFFNVDGQMVLMDDLKNRISAHIELFNSELTIHLDPLQTKKATDELRETLRALRSKLRKEAESLKFDLLMKKSYLFKKPMYDNPAYFIIFHDIYLSDHEISVIK